MSFFEAGSRALFFPHILKRLSADDLFSLLNSGGITLPFHCRVATAYYL
ncbi:MAG: hypothetical protein PHH79_06015 [Aminobacterium colombiense]|nr:hypothetical protein [Aminobacterium colombiense]